MFFILINLHRNHIFYINYFPGMGMNIHMVGHKNQQGYARLIELVKSREVVLGLDIYKIVKKALSGSYKKHVIQLSSNTPTIQ